MADANSSIDVANVLVQAVNATAYLVVHQISSDAALDIDLLNRQT